MSTTVRYYPARSRDCATHCADGWTVNSRRTAHRIRACYRRLRRAGIAEWEARSIVIDLLGAGTFGHHSITTSQAA